MSSLNANVMFKPFVKHLLFRNSVISEVGIWHQRSFLPLIALTYSYRRGCVSHAMVRNFLTMFPKSLWEESRWETCDHHATFLVTFFPVDVHVTSMEHFISWWRSPLSYEDSCKFWVLEKLFGVALQSWLGWDVSSRNAELSRFHSPGMKIKCYL